jgi:hypothetical protein
MVLIPRKLRLLNNRYKRQSLYKTV